MKKMIAFSLTLAIAIAANLSSVTAAQYINIAISDIYVISVNSSSLILTVGTPSAGADFSAVTNSATNYNVSINSTTARKITASVANALPTGCTLNVALTAPSTGTSSGAITLSTTAQDVVRGLTSVAGSGLPITYTLQVALAKAAIATNSSVVNYTLIAQ